VLSCVVTNAEVLHECRPSVHERFEITCPHKDVIIIHSAEVGFVPYTDSNNHTALDQCELTHPIHVCKLSSELDDIITACNDRTSCNFSQEVFNRAQCFPSLNGYVINIEYKCIKSLGEVFFFILTAYTDTLVMLVLCSVVVALVIIIIIIIIIIINEND